MTALDEEPRSYTIGLPVTLTVQPDGTVTYEVDLSEASDLAEGQPLDWTTCEHPGCHTMPTPLYTEEQVDADVETVSAAVREGTIRPADVAGPLWPRADATAACGRCGSPPDSPDVTCSRCTPHPEDLPDA